MISYHNLINSHLWWVFGIKPVSCTIVDVDKLRSWKPDTVDLFNVVLERLTRLTNEAK